MIRVVLKYPIQILMAIVLAWILSAILTETNVFPTSPDAMNYPARTDRRISVLKDAKWFRFPYPGNLFVYMDTAADC